MISRADIAASWRTLAPIAALTTSIVFVWFAFQRRSAGFNLWSDFVTGLSTATIYGGALAAGFAAIWAASWNTANTTRLTTAARNPVWVRFGNFALLVAYQVTGYLLALAIVTTYAGASGTYGSPDPFWLAAIGCVLIISTALGYVAGTLLPNRWYTAPLIVLAMFAGLVFVRILRFPQAIQAMLPGITDMATVFDVSIPAMRIGQSALWIGSASALVLVVAALKRAKRARTPLGVAALCALVAVGGAGAVVLHDGRYAYGQSSRDNVCIDRGFALCVNAGYASAAQDLYVAFARFDSIVHDTPLEVGQLQQTMTGIEEQRDDETRYFTIEASDRFDVTASVQNYLTTYGSPRCSGAYDVRAMVFVDAWLSGYESSYLRADHADIISHLDNLNAMPPDAGHTWFIEHYDAYVACAVTLDDLP